MLQRALHSRLIIALLCAGGIGSVCAQLFPFTQHPALVLIQSAKPDVYTLLRWTYYGLMFSNPFFAVWGILSLGFTFTLRMPEVFHRNRKTTGGKLPALVPPSKREELQVVLGERHHPRLRIPAETPEWIWLPSAGLHTGILIFGAVGTGKTSTCMYPYSRDIFGFQPGDTRRKCAGLVLEVKGTFCHDIRQILEDYGRGDDYVEISLDGDVVYNPLLNNLEPYEQANTIAALLNSIFGKSKDNFWQAAYTNMITYVILLYRAVDGYVTLYDLYESCTNTEFLEKKLIAAMRGFEARYIVLAMKAFMALPAEMQAGVQWEEVKIDEGTTSTKKNVLIRVAWSKELEEALTRLNVKFVPEDTALPEGVDTVRRMQLFAVGRWFLGEWCQLDEKLRASIVASVAPFLGIFNQDQNAKRVFCPPQDAYSEQKNPDGKVYGKPIQSVRRLIEEGKVLALNFPVAQSQATARSLGTMVKKDFQRALLERIPDMKRRPYLHWRSVALVIDECHMFTGDGDAEFLSLARESRCIPLLCTQSVSSLRSSLDESSVRSFMQTLQTTIFLRTKDEYTAELASKLCGREERVRLSYNIGESGNNAKFSALTGTPVAASSSLSTSKSYTPQKDNLFDPKDFTTLSNAQAIVLGYDGYEPIAATLIYLKPYYLPKNLNYFEQVDRGMFKPTEEPKVAAGI